MSSMSTVVTFVSISSLIKCFINSSFSSEPESDEFLQSGVFLYQFDGVSTFIFDRRDTVREKILY